MFALLELETRKTTSSELIVRAIGDAENCRTVKRQLITEGIAGREFQTYPVTQDCPLWVDSKDRFSIIILAVGTVQHCNRRADAELEGNAGWIRETVTPNDTGLRVLAQIVDHANAKAYPSDLYIGRLEMNRPAWRGSIPGTTFADNFRREAEEKKKFPWETRRGPDGRPLIFGLHREEHSSAK